MKVVLREEESVETTLLCEQLREQARTACRGNSDTVDRLEWKAARVIEILERDSGESRRD